MWLIIFLVTVSAPSLAAQVWQSSTVKWIYPQNDGSFVIAFTVDSSTCTSISSPKYYTVIAGQSGVNADAVKAMLSTALTAFATGSVLSINFDDATSNCFVNRMILQ
jgi:hypothetical protein